MFYRPFSINVRKENKMGEHPIGNINYLNFSFFPLLY